MGQKAHPIGNRLGIIRGWDSNWYGGKNYSDKLVEDEKIRKYLLARLAKGGVSRIVIERTLKLITVTIHTARPGIVIGKGGAEVDKLKEEIKKLTKKDVQINIYEIKRPENRCSVSSRWYCSSVRSKDFFPSCNEASGSRNNACWCRWN